MAKMYEADHEGQHFELSSDLSLKFFLLTKEGGLWHPVSGHLNYDNAFLHSGNAERTAIVPCKPKRSK
jgi:hypothetical protein